MFGIILGWMLNAAGSHYFGELLDILIKHLAGQKPEQKVIDAFSKGKMSERDKQLLASMTENAFRTDADFRDKLIALLLQEGIAAPIDSLPKPPELFGRTKDLRDLRRLLNPHTTNAPSCIQITGGTGVGKTRLAAKAVLDFRLDYIRIELREHFTAELVAEQLYKMLTWRKHAEGSFEDVVRAIVESWRRRDCLLIIDNLQYLLDKTQPEDDKAQLLLKALAESGNKLLVICWGETDAFGLTGEKVKRIHLEGLIDKAGVLKLRAEEVKGAPQSISLEDVVKRLDGNPLMLELLAGLVKRHGGDALVIDKRPDWIENSTAPMTAMWKEIGPDLQELITALCIFRMGRTPERLTRYLSRDISVIQHDLDALIDWHLAGCNLDLQDYYPRHDIVRDMVNKALTEEELKEYHTKAADLWLEEGKDIGKNGVPNKIEQIRPLLAAGYHLAEAGEAKRLLEEVVAKYFGNGLEFFEIAFRLGAWSDTIFILEGLIAIESEEEIIGSTRHNLGILYLVRGDFDAALIEYRASMEIFKRLGAKKQIAQSRHQQGIVYQHKGNLDAALGEYQASHEILKQLGDEWEIAKSRHQIGRVYLEKGDLDVAWIEYKAGLDVFERLGDEMGIAIGRHQIANIYFLKGDLDAALIEYQASLEIEERLGDIQGIAMTNAQLGQLHRELGKYPEALTYSLKALSIYRQLGDPQMSQALRDLARLRTVWNPIEFKKAWREHTGNDVPEEIIKASEELKKQQ